MAIIPRYRDTRYWYPILTLILEYHVTDIGTPDIDPDIDPDIGYMVYDIGDMTSGIRYTWIYWYVLVCTFMKSTYEYIRVQVDTSRYVF